MTIIDTAAPETNSVPLPSLAEQLRTVADELDRQAREAAKASHPAFQTSDVVEQAYDWWAEDDEFPEPIEQPTLPFGDGVIHAGDKVKIRSVKVGNTGHPRFHKYKESLDWLEVKVNRLNQLHAEGYLLDKVEILEHEPALPDWERELLEIADNYTKAEREANGRRVFVLAKEADWVFRDLGFSTHGSVCNEDVCEVEVDPDEFWPVFEVGDRVVTSDTPFWHRWTGDIAPLVGDLYRGAGTVVRLGNASSSGDVEVRLDRGYSLFFARECLTLLPQPVEPEVVEEKPAEAVPSFSVGDKVKIIAEPYWRDGGADAVNHEFLGSKDRPAPALGDLAVVRDAEPDDDGDIVIVLDGTDDAWWCIAPEVLELVKEERPLAVGDRVRAVRDTTSIFGNTISAGWTGTVLGPWKDGSFTAVDWDNGSGYNVPPTADLERISEPKPLAVGDRVRVTNYGPREGEFSIAGHLGTIVRVSGDGACPWVELDEDAYRDTFSDPVPVPPGELERV